MAIAYAQENGYTFLIPPLIRIRDTLKNEKMTHEEKINYMRIAAGICNYGFDSKGLDMMVSIYELVIEKQGNTDLRTITSLQEEVKKRDDAKKRSELLDKVSKKID